MVLVREISTIDTMLCLLPCLPRMCVSEPGQGEAPRQKVMLPKGVEHGGCVWGGNGVGNMEMLQGWWKSMGGRKGKRGASRKPWKTGFAHASAQCGMFTSQTHTTLPSCFPKWNMAEFLQFKGIQELLKLLLLLTSVSLLSKSLLACPHITDFCLFVLRNYFYHPDNLGCTRKAGSSIAFILPTVVMMGDDSKVSIHCVDGLVI